MTEVTPTPEEIRRVARAYSDSCESISALNARDELFAWADELDRQQRHRTWRARTISALAQRLNTESFFTDQGDPVPMLNLRYLASALLEMVETQQADRDREEDS